MRRILLVENSPTQACAFGMMMENEGLSYETVTTGDEALKRLRQETFHLLLTSLTLPDQTGIELCRSVKFAQDFEPILVIVLTGSADPVHVLNSIEAGADGYIAKNRDAKLIVEQIRTILDQRPLTEKPATTEITFRGQKYILAVSNEQIQHVLLSAVDDVTKTNALQTDLNQQLELELKQHRNNQQDSLESKLYRSLIEDVPVAMFRKDIDGHFTFANRLFCRELGCEPADIIGKTDFDFFPEELAKKYRRNDQTVIEQDRLFDDVEQHHTPDGRRIFVHVMKFPVRDDSGLVNGVQAVFWDVTNQTLADQQIAADEITDNASNSNSEHSSEQLRFLLAEDSATNQLLARALLTREGHEVAVAGDGVEAVELSANQEFDAILMDVEMPTLNGLDAARRIRNREQSTGGHIPIIAITASSSKSHNQACLDAGMDAVISKPIRVDRIVSVLDELGSTRN